MRKVWALVLTYDHPDKPYRNVLRSCVKLYKTEAEAVNALNDVIRNDWATVVVSYDSDGSVLLVDLADYPEDDSHGGPMHSQCYYSKDRHVAWAYYAGGRGHRGEVKELEVPE